VCIFFPLAKLWSLLLNRLKQTRYECFAILTPIGNWGLKNRGAAQLKDFDSKKVLEIKNNY